MSDLAVTYDSLRAAVGYYLGYGRDYDSFSTDQAANVAAALEGGLRQFYFPPPSPTSKGGYQWTFLRPVLDIALVADVRDYQLPDGFVCFEGDLHVSASNNTYNAIPRRTVGQLLQLRAEAGGTVTGIPYCCAVRPTMTQAGGQKFELMVYPTPNDSYTIRAPLQITPPALGADNPHPYGGAAHGETIRESCLAWAELNIDDAPQGGHAGKFMERLAASIDADARLRPSNLGYAGDGSGGNANWQEAQRSVYATWNDTLYEG